jgi:hypothetical protein
MTQQVLCVVTVLLGHQVDNMESIDSQNNSQHEFLCPDLVLHLLRDITLRYAPFRRMMKFQSEPNLIPSHKSLKFYLLMP